jgi:hypothetical protein
MAYTPDKWLVVKLDHDGETHYRVFATWYGGYLHGDSWQLNSGIVSVIEDEKCYYFNGVSGSVYQCFKGAYGHSGYSGSVLHGLIEDSKANGIIITVLEDQDWMKVNYE